MSDPDEGVLQAAACAQADGREVSNLPSGEGEDDPLILWFLSLTPTERVEVAQDFVDSARMLRDGLRS